MIDINEIIENTTGPELKVFEREMENLTQKQLEQINVEVGIYKDEEVEGIDRDFLEISAGEVAWSDFFIAYRNIMGRPFVLDPDKDR